MSMPTAKDYNKDSITATADITKARFVGSDGEHCGADERAVGISIEDVDSGDEATLKVGGAAVVEAGAAVVAGRIASDSVGRAVNADFPEGTTSIVVADLDAVNGYTFDTASAAGEYIKVYLDRI